MPDTGARASRTVDDGRTRGRTADREIEIVRHDAGVDMPFVGHVAYRSLGLYGGLAVAGAVGVIEWPVAAAVGVAYALARRA